MGAGHQLSEKGIKSHASAVRVHRAADLYFPEESKMDYKLHNMSKPVNKARETM